MSNRPLDAPVRGTQSCVSAKITDFFLSELATKEKMRVENSRKDLEMKEKAAADRLKEIEESMNPKKPPEQPKKPKPPTPDGKYFKIITQILYIFF